MKLEKQSLCQTRLTFSKSRSFSRSFASRNFVQLCDTCMAREFRNVSTPGGVDWRSGHPARTFWQMIHLLMVDWEALFRLTLAAGSISWNKVQFNHPLVRTEGGRLYLYQLHS